MYIPTYDACKVHHNLFFYYVAILTEFYRCFTFLNFERVWPLYVVCTSVLFFAATQQVNQKADWVVVVVVVSRVCKKI